MTNTNKEAWEEKFDRLVEDTTGESDEVFFPFGGDNHDFSKENCKKFIRNLLKSHTD